MLKSHKIGIRGLSPDFVILVLILCTALTCSTHAQDFSKLKVFVRDQNSDAVAEYIIRLTNVEGGFDKTKTGSTDSTSAVFESLPVGRYQIQISAPGFEKYQKELLLKKGSNSANVILKVSAINETIEIGLSENEKRFEESISKVFTKQEISELPAGPDSIKAELKRRYGNDVEFQVDGFSGGKIPDRSRIAAIKVIYNVLDAEFHTIGTPMVQITTKPGGEKWAGFVSMSHSNSILNARNSFEKEKLPMRLTTFFASIAPPKLSKDTSLAMSFSNSKNTNEQYFIGILPESFSAGGRKSNFKSSFGSIGIYQNLPREHIGYLNYSFSSADGDGIGLGGFDSAERAYQSVNRIHTLRYSQNGSIKQVHNHFRAEFSKLKSSFKPISRKPTVLILDTLNFGGAGNETESDTTKFTLANILTFDHKKHLLKFGGEFLYESAWQMRASNQNGTYTFSDIQSFNQKSPLIYTQRIGENFARVSQTQLSLFFQDYIRVAKHFQVGIGLRYEWQNVVSDFNNFSPRLHFVWSPLRSAKFTVQGSFGQVYSWLNTSSLVTIESDNGGNSAEFVFIKPEFPISFSTDTVAFESSVKPSIKSLSKEIRNTKLIYGMIGIKWELSKETLIRAAYILSGSRSVFRSRDVNTAFEGVRPNSDFGRISLLESRGSLRNRKLGVSIDTKIAQIPVFAHYFFSRIKMRGIVFFPCPRIARIPELMSVLPGQFPSIFLSYLHVSRWINLRSGHFLKILISISRRKSFQVCRTQLLRAKMKILIQ